MVEYLQIQKYLLLNYYFVTVAKTLLEKTSETNNSYQEKQNYKKIIQKIEEQQKLLNTNKANDIFGISPKILRIAAKNIIETLTYIFNELLRNDVAPAKLKKTIKSPVCKRTPG